MSGNSDFAEKISPTRAFSIFKFIFSLRSVTVNEAIVRFLVDSSEKVPNFTDAVFTGAWICKVILSVIALHVAPESRSAYVGTVACPADTNTGTMGRMATVPAHALASQLAAVHSSLCKIE